MPWSIRIAVSPALFLSSAASRSLRTDRVMLRTQLIHPEILRALGAAGHGATVLIADGNYPASTFVGPRASVVSLNLSPGIVNCVEVLEALVTAIPLEKAQVMQPHDGSRPPIWNDFERVLSVSGFIEPLEPVERFSFYRAASTDQHALTIQTGEQRVWANLLLTIGVRM
jgi:L-fucose mutarotase